MPQAFWLPVANRRLLAGPLIVALLALLAGCGEKPATTRVATQAAAGGIEEKPADSAPPRPAAGPVLPPAVAAPIAEQADDGQLIEDHWDAYSIQGVRVGYGRTTVARVNESGRELVRTRNTARTRLKRAGQTIVQDMTLTSWETAGGELVRFETKMTTGPGEIVSRGRVDGDKLTIQTATLGKTQSQTIPWPSGTGGLFAAEQSLRRQPLKSGERRSVTCLMPVFNSVGTSELTAADYELVKLPSGEQKLLRVDSVIDLQGQKLQTVVWIDEAGQTLKSLVPAIGQEAVRTTKEDALEQPAGAPFDLLVASVVKLKGDLPQPLTTRRVVYRASVKSGKIEGVFANCLSQRVKQIDEQTAEVTVTAVRPGEPKSADIEQTKPSDGDLAASNLIQSDDPQIIEMAARGAPPSDNAWEVAVGLEEYVSKRIRKKNFSQAFATAGEVARSLEGDCTEHAVLLAALCRARKIPSRVAFGLVYYPPQQGFAYHMWNEVWMGDRWVPLDGTLGMGGIGADHLKLADTDLAGGTGLAAMLPVVQVFGRLELEVLEAQW
jgi:hypothetical protein